MKEIILSMAILLGFIVFGNNVFAANNKKVLVVYYSNTGTTEGVAKIIAKETNADLVKLEPKIPYTEADLNWSDKNSRVIKEHENLDKVHVELKNAKSSKRLEKLAGTGNWLPGQRFSNHYSEKEVLAWVKKLNIK